jgi:hypothetical protein
MAPRRRISTPTILSLGRINRLRQAAARLCKVPEDTPEGWSVSRVDPNLVLAAFKALRLKPGWTLCAYQFVQDENGNGFVYAVPANALVPAPEQCPRNEDRFLAPPVPPGGVEPLEAVEGDGSPWSYMSASLFAREIREFGAIWHGCDWVDHAILGANPLASSGRSRLTHTPEAEWEWKDAEPTEWTPTVMTGDMVRVRFYTFTALGSERIIYHEDVYALGKYLPTSHAAVIAVGGAGFVY